MGTQNMDNSFSNQFQQNSLEPDAGQRKPVPNLTNPYEQNAAYSADENPYRSPMECEPANLYGKTQTFNHEKL